MKKVLNWLYDYPDLKVYQFQDGFKFSLDSILLAEFAEIRKNDEHIIDLCTGNGVIPILLAHKYQKIVTGVEIQAEIAQLARESVAYNSMDSMVTILEKDVLELKNYFPGNNFDVVLSNPPYFKYHHTKFVNDNEMKGIARHELKISLEQLVEMASYLLKSKGRFYLVHIPERLEEICVYAHKYGFSVKQIQFVSSKDGEAPIIVLVCLVKDGKFGCKVRPTLSIENRESYQNIFNL
ncbi:TPA: methyltransferase [Candidatus Ventrenecus stercoripullorum]|nr:methyltransferase [Candidatus Ventrenecus stercoripullorum]